MSFPALSFPAFPYPLEPYATPYTEPPGQTIDAYKWVTLREALTALTIPFNWTKAYFTVKTSTSHDDSAALIQIVASNPAVPATDGMLYLAGAAATDKSDGALTLNATEGTATITVTDEAMGLLVARSGMCWDLKALVANDSSASLIDIGIFNVSDAVTRTT